MATLLLTTAGSFAGAAFGGPLALTLGKAIGAVAGYAMDQTLLGKRSHHSQGHRLESLQVQASTEGAPVPKVYGRSRLAGQIIWAPEFEEFSSTQSQGGGKGGSRSGGASQTSYSYYASFAVGLCEGPITGIGRIWVDGDLMDTAGITYRLYKGTSAQLPDSLIRAHYDHEVPAYRDLAYIVFERLPINRYGRRIPQLNFEVFRQIGGGLEDKITAVSIVPGTTEFGYSPVPVTRGASQFEQTPENSHADPAKSDWTVALDDLMARCPNLEYAALVVSWFASDLRCGHCRLTPRVRTSSKQTRPVVWSVAGLDRRSAHPVSTHNRQPAFGGTPSDESVVAAIRDLKSRGLRVMFHPVIVMDIAADNRLPDPLSGAAAQPAYPPTRLITCDPAPGREGSPDRTRRVSSQIGRFFGRAFASEFTVSGSRVEYSGAQEWSLRRMILHYAYLCRAAGGVESFLIASGLPGLTGLRSGVSTYPAVQALTRLAGDVRGILGAGTKISYAADWRECTGHRPADRPREMHFHLDPLWASANIDFIGVNNFMPVSDWREGADHLDARRYTSIYDRYYLLRNIAGGEGYHWRYRNQADRRRQRRTPITDTAYSRPWVFRFKDFRSWWSNAHFDRPRGVEKKTATSWVQRSKPIRFTAFGTGALDKSTNKPDAAGNERTGWPDRPQDSRGTRDDLVQRAYLEATFDFWRSGNQNNPAASAYGGTMVDTRAMFVWAWDARPYPQFPMLTDIWHDGRDWETGYSLSGRLGTLTQGQLVQRILHDFGIRGHSTAQLHGVLTGYVIDRPMSARAALEPLSQAGFFDAAESGGSLVFAPRLKPASAMIDRNTLVEDGQKPMVSIARAQETELPSIVAVGYSDMKIDYQHAVATSRRLVGQSRRLVNFDYAMVIDAEHAERIAHVLLHDAWASRERLEFALAPSALSIEVGDTVLLAAQGRRIRALITRIEDAILRRIEARTIAAPALSPVGGAHREGRINTPRVYNPPIVQILDLPVLRDTQRNHHAPWIAAYADPWPGSLAVYRGQGGGALSRLDTLEQGATMGVLAGPLGAGPLGRWDRGNALDVQIYGGTLSSATRLDVLGGENVIAVKARNGAWEIIQYREAKLIARRTFRLRGLLRGQRGSEDATRATSAPEAPVVVLNAAVKQLDTEQGDIGRVFRFRVGPQARDHGDPLYSTLDTRWSGRGMKPFSPVHIAAWRVGGSRGAVHISWIRRSRTPGDNWEVAEVPLGETGERYVVRIFNRGRVVRRIEVDAAAYVYRSADEIADFKAPQSALEISVAQISALVGEGIAARAFLKVQ